MVISRSPQNLPANCFPARSLPEAIELAGELASGDEVVIIGGAEIYRQALPLVDRMYITEVHLQPEGDTFFPAFDPGQWREIERENVPATADSAIAYSIVTYQRH